MEIIQNLIAETIRSTFGKMTEENKKIKEEPIDEEMTEIKPAKEFGFSEIEVAKKFGFSEETEEKPKAPRNPLLEPALGFSEEKPFTLKAPRNEGGETYLDVLKREKEEDKEFYRMICIQEKRRLERNPHLKTGTFGPGTGTKTLYDKIQDLLKDYYYPENEFNRLKLDVILAERQLEETQETLNLVGIQLEETQEKLKRTEKEKQEEIKELKEKIQDQEKEINELQETPPLYFSEEEYKKLYTFKWMLEHELERAEEKRIKLLAQLTEKEHELQETKAQLEENRQIMQRMEDEMEEWEDIDYVKKSKELEKQLKEKEKELQEYKDKVKQMELVVLRMKDDIQRMKDEVLRSRQAFYDATETGYFRAIQSEAERKALEAKEKLAFVETEFEKTKKGDTHFLGEILDEVLPHIRNMTQKTVTEARKWLGAVAEGKQREAWSIYVEPEIATEEKFKSLKELFTEHCKKFCFVRNGRTHNISGEIQLKKPLNVDQLNELLGPNIYLNGGPKEEATEKWSMAAKFNEKGYFSIYFTDETKKGNKVACEVPNYLTKE